MIESIRTYYDPNFAYQPYQATLLMIALGFAAVPFNTIWRKWLPAFESTVLVLHFLGFIIIVVTLCIMAPKNSADTVFNNVQNNGGWSSTGLSMMVGQVANVGSAKYLQACILYTMAGADSVVHMAEEVDDSSLTVPRAMVWSYVLNTILGFAMMITMCFCMGSLEDAINADEPFINAFLNGTGSPVAATLLTLVVLVVLSCGNVTCIATESRQMWAFGRDKGMPFSTWIAKVSPRYQVPLNSIWVTMAINIVLCLINLGSSFAFNIIIGISLVGTTATYILSIACLLSARYRNQKLPKVRWSLGRSGAPINIFAVLFASMMLIFSLFPVIVPVDTSTMNWTVVVVGAVLGFAIILYWIQGRKIYKGPVIYVEGKRDHGLIQTTEGDTTVQDAYRTPEKVVMTTMDG